MAGGETGRSLADAAAFRCSRKPEVLGGPQEACADDRDVCAVLGQILLRTLRVPE